MNQLRFDTYSLLITVGVAVTAATVLTGCGLNHQGVTYTRARNYSPCERPVLALQVPGSVMCCDEALRDSDWICVAMFDATNRTLGSLWAFVIPLLAPLVTLLVELLCLYSSKKCMSGTHYSSRLTATLRRMGFYCLISAYRTVRPR